MKTTPPTAMIMAAGHGTRMRPLTEKLPKPLIKVAGRTLIDRTLDHLIAVGVQNVVVNVHYLADTIEKHLAKRDEINLTISDERNQLLGSGGALVAARPLMGEQPYLILNADACWIDDGHNLQSLIDGFDPDLMDVRLLLADRKQTIGYSGNGDFDLDTLGRIDLKSGSRPYVMAGAYMLSASTLDGLKPEPFSARQIWLESCAKQRAYGRVMNTMWMHVGDPLALASAERYIRT